MLVSQVLGLGAMFVLGRDVGRRGAFKEISRDYELMLKPHEEENR